MKSATSLSDTSSIECWIAKDADQLADAAYKLLQTVVTEANSTKSESRQTVALSGGSTPKKLFERMTRSDVDTTTWHKVDWFWSDERNVPLDHADSNFGMAHRYLLHPAGVPTDKIHPVPISIEDASGTAKRYEQTIRQLVPQRNGEHPCFSLIFLGLGDDAHTASLFPETAALQENERDVVSNYVPKLNCERITFTAPLINAADSVVFLVSGVSKTKALEQIWHGPRNSSLYPAQLIHGSRRLIWLVDQAAIGSVSPPGTALVQQL